MDTDELKERYKSLPIWARLLIALGIGLLPAGYTYYDEGDVIASDLEAAQAEQESAQGKLDRAIAKKKKIPEVEERLAELEEQLTKAKKVLPDSFRVEDVLQKTAAIAKETGVRIRLFNPEEEKPGKGDYKYMELPIATELEGRFNQMAAFFDRMVHLEQSLFIRNIEMSVAQPAEEMTPDPQKSEHQIALEMRQKLESKAKFQIVVYRSMSDQEVATAEAAMDPPEETGKKKKKKAEDGEQNPADKAGDEAGGKE